MEVVLSFYFYMGPSDLHTQACTASVLPSPPSFFFFNVNTFPDMLTHV